MKITGIDILGFLLSAIMTTVPMIVIAPFFDPRPVKPPFEVHEPRPAVYIVPAAVGAIAAVASSLFACWLERDSHIEPEFDNWRRLFTHGGMAALTLVVLMVTFCWFWSGWAIATSKRL